MSRKKNKTRTRAAPAPVPARPAATTSSVAAVLWVAAAASLAGFGVVYLAFRGVQTPAGMAPPPPPQSAQSVPAPATPAGTAAPANSPASHPLAKGQMAAFVFKKTPEPLPEIVFEDATGRERHLADWKGQAVLLNLWATWCAPCRKEMPALDRLQKDLGGADFEVVALAVDRAGIEGAKKFLGETGAANLAVYADPAAKAGTLLRAVGMPTTLVIGRDGREVGRLVGPAEWDSPEAKDLLRSVLAEKPAN